MYVESFPKRGIEASSIFDFFSRLRAVCSAKDQERSHRRDRKQYKLNRRSRCPFCKWTISAETHRDSREWSWYKHSIKPLLQLALLLLLLLLQTTTCTSPHSDQSTQSVVTLKRKSDLLAKTEGGEDWWCKKDLQIPTVTAITGELSRTWTKQSRWLVLLWQELFLFYHKQWDVSNYYEVWSLFNFLILCLHRPKNDRRSKVSVTSHLIYTINASRPSHHCKWDVMRVGRALLHLLG